MIDEVFHEFHPRIRDLFYEAINRRLPRTGEPERRCRHCPHRAPRQPTEWIDERGLDLLDRWSRLTVDAAHTGLMVLIACRIWLWAVERRHASKEEAGHWALERDPTLQAVEAALAERREHVSRNVSPTDVARVLDAARRAVERRRSA